MKFEITILGCGSALPTLSRRPTSQVLNIHEKFFLIDCGEGTQIQLRQYKINFQRINQIFISHLHGDHFFGLCGLLSTYHLLGRKTKIQIFSPPGLKEILNIQFKYSQTFLKYPIEYIELESSTKQPIYEDNKITVRSFPLKHRIPCYGFLFSENPKPKNILKESVIKYNIPISHIPSIKLGQDFVTQTGEIIANRSITKPQPPSYSYAFCSDTAYNESIIPYIQGVDLLYHEATFTKEMKDRAKKTFHSTTLDAANIAKLAQVKKLLIGHFSARYKDTDEFLLECKTIFKNTSIAKEGLTIRLY